MRIAVERVAAECLKPINLLGLLDGFHNIKGRQRPE